MTVLTSTHDGVSPLVFPIAALVFIAGVGVFIALVARTARAVGCCPHPDLNDFPEEVTHG